MASCVSELQSPISGIHSSPASSLAGISSSLSMNASSLGEGVSFAATDDDRRNSKRQFLRALLLVVPVRLAP